MEEVEMKQMLVGMYEVKYPSSERCNWVFSHATRFHLISDVLITIPDSLSDMGEVQAARRMNLFVVILENWLWFL